MTPDAEALFQQTMAVFCAYIDERDNTIEGSISAKAALELRRRFVAHVLCGTDVKGVSRVTLTADDPIPVR